MDRPSILRVLLTAACVCGATVLITGQDRQFRTGTDTIPVFATAVDATGRLVTDLTRDDFEILDNGRPQPLTTFVNEAQPITVVMMLDRSGSVVGQFPLVERAAAEFVNQLAPDDRARIGSFSLKIRIDPASFTSDHDTLLDVLRSDLQPFGPTPLWNATDAAMTAVAGESGRRVVLVFTDGRDLPVDDGPDVTYEQIRHRVETEDVMLYAIGLAGECGPAPDVTISHSGSALDQVPAFQARGGGGRGGGGRGGGRAGGQGRGGGQGGGGARGRGPGGIPLPGFPMPPRPVPFPGFPPPTKPPTGVDSVRAKDPSAACSSRTPDPHLHALTAIGGGGYFELHQTADLNSTFARVIEELHRQYLLAFVAPERDGVLHHLQLRVKRPGVTVRARTGYVAPGGEGASPAPAAAPAQTTSSSATARGREMALVANAESATVAFFDVASRSVAGALDINPEHEKAEGPGRPNFAQDTDVSPDGRTLYVSRGYVGDVAAFDLTTGKLLWKRPLNTGRADHMTLSPDGRSIFVSAMMDNRVYQIATATGEITGHIVTGIYPHDNKVSRDGQWLYNTSIGPISGLPRRAGAEPLTEAPGFPFQLTIANARTLEVRDRIQLDHAIRPWQFTPDEKGMYAQIANEHAVVFYDIAARKFVRRLELPVKPGVTTADYDFEAPHHGLALTPDGRTLCLAGRASDYAALVRAPELTLLTTIPVGDAPGWAETADNGRLCLIANTRSDDLSVISIADRKEILRVPIGDAPKHITVTTLPVPVIEAVRRRSGS